MMLIVFIVCPDDSSFPLYCSLGYLRSFKEWHHIHFSCAWLPASLWPRVLFSDSLMKVFSRRKSAYVWLCDPIGYAVAIWRQLLLHPSCVRVMHGALSDPRYFPFDSFGSRVICPVFIHSKLPLYKLSIWHSWSGVDKYGSIMLAGFELGPLSHLRRRII